MVVGKRAEALATLDNDDSYATVATGHYGKGRVVVFSGHPQYTVAFRSGQNSRKYNTDAKANMRMVFRAFEYVSWATGEHRKCHGEHRR